MDNPTKLTVLGGGNMGEAMIRGALRSGILAAEEIVVSDPSAERRDQLHAALGVRTTADNGDAVAGAEIVLLAVKPQVFGVVIAALPRPLPVGALFVSVAAGIRTEDLEAMLGPGTRVVRAMPNTPALVGAGMTAYCGGRWAEASDLARAEALLAGMGRALPVREADMDAVTAVSGSGPAYVFAFMEGMLRGASALGLSPALARALMLQTFAGATALAEQTADDPAALRARVTSKGGTTAAALNVLHARGFGDAIVEAMAACADRAREMAEAFGGQPAERSDSEP